MSRRYIADLTPGENVESQVFLIASKDLRTTTQGSLYIHAVLADKTGQMVARAWQASEAMYKVLPAGGFVELKGRAESYKGTMQFIVEAIRPIDQNKIDLTEFLPASKRDIDEMWARTREILGGIKDPYLQALVHEFLSDEEKMRLFLRAPAAIKMHHAHIGGLLEHTLNLLELALLIIPRYPRVSMDLVLAGLLLHDFGKTAELGYATNFTYTDEGQLLGHISICAGWVEQMSARAATAMGKPFPNEIKWALQHIVLSHHLRPEFGSPKIPATPEAIAIHYIDNLDAKLDMYVAAIDADKDDDSRWTSYHFGIETKVYKRNVLDQPD